MSIDPDRRKYPSDTTDTEGHKRGTSRRDTTSSSLLPHSGASYNSRVTGRFGLPILSGVQVGRGGPRTEVRSVSELTAIQFTTDGRAGGRKDRWTVPNYGSGSSLHHHLGRLP